jgi:ribose transport system permease protein
MSVAPVSLSARARLIRMLALGEAGAIGALIIITLIFWLLEPAFLSERNVRAMLNVVSFLGIIGIGQTLLLINGEFDLSVGSVAGLAAVVSAKLMTALGWPVPVALFGGLLAGATVGLINGLAVVVLRIPAFIQTLGMLFIGQGLIQIVTGGYPVYPLPAQVGEFGRTPVIAGLTGSFVFFILAAVIGDVLLRRTVLGRNMYATGGNARVAELVGIPTRLYKISTFVTVGVLSSIAGMFVMADLASAGTGIGAGWELSVIAGVVVGGVSLFGGVGTLVGGLIGVLLLQVVQSGLVTVGVSANWQQIAVGLIMIVAVGLDTLRRRLASNPTAAAAPSPTAQWKFKILTAAGIGVAVVSIWGIRAAHVHSTGTPAIAADTKHLLWVQPLRDHPVCKLMQAGFLNRCKILGYACEIVGNASATTLDVAATIPLAQAALARQRFAAVGVFTLDTSIYPFVAQLAAEGVPVVTWHELPPPGAIPGLKAATGQDLAQLGQDAALAMGARLQGRGVVAITQGSFNVEENTKADSFRRALAQHYPSIKVLESQLEGFEATAAKAKAISLLQGHPDITGIFSTTGNGAQTWISSNPVRCTPSWHNLCTRKGRGPQT